RWLHVRVHHLSTDRVACLRGARLRDQGPVLDGGRRRRTVHRDRDLARDLPAPLRELKTIGRRGSREGPVRSETSAPPVGNRHTPAAAEAGESEKALTGESQGYSVRPPGLEP